MNLALYIYLCDVVGNIGWMLGFIFAVALVAVVIVSFAFFPVISEGDSNDFKIWTKFAMVIYPLFLVTFLVRASVPSQKTMYAMAAAYYGEQAVKSETFQRLNGKAMQLLEVKIDELISEKK